MKRSMVCAVVCACALFLFQLNLTAQIIEVAIEGDSEEACIGESEVREHSVVWDFFEGGEPYEVQGISCSLVVENSGDAESFLREAYLHKDVPGFLGGIPDFIVLDFYTEEDLEHASARTTDGSGITGNWQAVSQVMVFDYEQEENLPAPSEGFGALSFKVCYEAPDAGTSSLEFGDYIGTPPKVTSAVVGNSRVFPKQHHNLQVSFTECPVELYIGDANCDDLVDISDPVYILSYLFGGPEEPPVEQCCRANEDANNDNRVDISDAVKILGFLFSGGDMIAPDGSILKPSSIGCRSYSRAETGLPCNTQCVP